MHTRHPFSLLSRAVGVELALALALASIVTVQAAGSPATASAIQGEVDGHPIAVTEVPRFHCHDLASPVIRCFTTAAARDADEAAVVRALALGGTHTTGATAVTSTPYVRWYLDADYGGPSFDAFLPYRDLGTIGWNDKISSFTTYAGGHARWWRDIGFAGASWDWGAGVSVPNVGSAANDQFSSVGRL